MKEILSKIFGGAATNVADGLAGIVDKFVKTPEEKDAFEKEMTQLFMKHEADMENISIFVIRIIIKKLKS